jgi:hypothetical protein
VFGLKKKLSPEQKAVLKPSHRRLYFDKAAQKDGEYNYVAGEWYDGVPEDHFKKFIQSGAAREVIHEQDGCGLGCLVTADDGRAVSVRSHPEQSPYAHQECIVHGPDAHRPQLMDAWPDELAMPDWKKLGVGVVAK